jgi:hypothetical protein
MHPLFAQPSELTHDVIGAAIEVHKDSTCSSIVEVKAVTDVHPINNAQLLSYMRLLDIPLGLIINFNELKLADGVSSALSVPKVRL